MSKLHELFPTAEALLEQTPETLARTLLRIGASERQQGMFWPPNVLQVTIGSGMSAEGQHAYAHHQQHQVDALVGETWELLRRTGILHPAPDTNGQNGWMVLICLLGLVFVKENDGLKQLFVLVKLRHSASHPSRIGRSLRPKGQNCHFWKFNALQTSVQRSRRL
jgi:hypothetical protein